MIKKKIAFIAAGWAGCTAVAFWTGMHWNGEYGASTDKSRRMAVMQHAGLASEATGSTAARGAGQVSGVAGKEGVLPGSKAIRDLTPEETAARVKEIFAIEDPLQRMEAYLEFVKGVQGSEQMAIAMEAMTENGYNNRERGREFSMFMNRWAKEDPESALAWTQKHDDWRSSRGAGTALAIWAQQDPDKAIAWAQAHPNKDKEEGNHHMASVIGSLAKSNLNLASQLAQKMDASDARGNAMDRVLEQYFNQRGDAATKEMVMGLADGPYKNGILGRLADRLAGSDAKAAAAWAATLPDGEAKPRIVATVINEWAEKNPTDAGNWLNALPKTAATDEPRERFAYKVQERDPEAAMAWANTITDPERRNHTAFRLVREWMEREPDNARAWVTTSQLPADMKERLLNRRKG